MVHAFIHRLSTPHHCPRPLSAARAQRVFPRQTTRFNLLILMTYEVKPNDQGSPSYGWPHLPLKGLSITFESHSAGKSNNFPRQRDDRVYPVSSLSCIYNLRYCSFRGDKEGVEWREGRRERERHVERRNRETARFDCCSLRKPVPLSSFIIFAATSPRHPCARLQNAFSRPRNGLL